MNLSAMMGAHLSQLQQTISIGLLDMAQATQAAQATVMLNDFTQTQAGAAQAPHPTLGRHLDIRV